MYLHSIIILLYIPTQVFKHTYTALLYYYTYLHGIIIHTYTALLYIPTQHYYIPTRHHYTNLHALLNLHSIITYLHDIIIHTYTALLYY